MMAQNVMLQHQMQNVPMSVNQHKAPHHLHIYTTTMNEINGMCIIDMY